MAGEPPQPQEPPKPPQPQDPRTALTEANNTLNEFFNSMIGNENIDDFNTKFNIKKYEGQKLQPEGSTTVNLLKIEYQNKLKEYLTSDNNILDQYKTLLLQILPKPPTE